MLHKDHWKRRKVSHALTSGVSLSGFDWATGGKDGCHRKVRGLNKVRRLRAVGSLEDEPPVKGIPRNLFLTLTLPLHPYCSFHLGPFSPSNLLPLHGLSLLTLHPSDPLELPSPSPPPTFNQWSLSVGYSGVVLRRPQLREIFSEASGFGFCPEKKETFHLLHKQLYFCTIHVTPGARGVQLSVMLLINSVL